eukprot:Plantae.Rhodophyta-Hildenbrandia_rubra.ctg4294.p1 GENE.Plantae.Rhodophyta-Hildenbrandia_rubra.ctg4294~~Plantae.Rhodophyta-Hildenbrandia_rubra.ctg4294.p1  ORF type:complete len:1513 (-),score=241.36 Plantae.Rhodophyta-Hildenbrandia_rubra.ctg4294:10033-13911(-)
MKNSPLLKELLAPRLNFGQSGVEHSAYRLARAREYADMVVKKLRLNPSQHRAINAATANAQGFNIIQGPPGTGKTRTLIALLNVMHMTQYQSYYEGLLASLEPKKVVSKSLGPSGGERKEKGQPKDAIGSSLQDMKESLTETLFTLSAADHDTQARPTRPRLLICAPSNAAVDEVVTRIVEGGFIDGQGRRYSPELVRTGYSERVSNAARLLTSEGQAASFLEPLHPAASTTKASASTTKGSACETSPAAKAQKRFLGSWQAKVNGLLLQLRQTPKTPEKRPLVISLHEQLERMERDLRRFSFAASPTMTREEKTKAISATYVEDAQLVFCTLSGAASVIRTMKKQRAEANCEVGSLFDTVVIDEAAQTSEPSCLIPLSANVDRCILVGDPQQLPATVFSSGESGIAYGQSLLERVCKSGRQLSFLDTQYRMHPSVSSFPRRYFYQNELKDAESVLGENCSKPWHHGNLKPKLGPYVFIDVAAAPERRSRSQSILNPTEAELAVMLYKSMKDSYPSDPLFARMDRRRSAGFGIITPYGAQKVAIRGALERAGVPTGEVEVDTVDAFQGREKEAVIFSCVRSNKHHGIGFVQDVRRMNVGLTRARSTLIVLGDGSSLSSGSADWRALIEDARGRGCYFQVTKLSEALLPTDFLGSPRTKQARPTENSSPDGKGNIAKETKGANGSQPHGARKRKTATAKGEKEKLKTLDSAVQGSKLVTNSTSHIDSDEKKLERHRGNQQKQEKDAPLWAEVKDQERVEQSLTNLFQQSLGKAQERNLGGAADNTKTTTGISAKIDALGIPSHPTLVQTLTSNIEKGGEIDFETILAAAQTCNVVTPQSAAQLTMRKEAEANTKKPASGKRPRVQQNPRAKNQGSQKNSFSKPKSSLQKHDVKDDTPARERPVQEVIPDRKDTLTDTHPAVPSKRKRSQVAKDDGSGWEMLFSKRRKGHQEAEEKPSPPARENGSVSESNGAPLETSTQEEETSDLTRPLFFVDRKPTESSQKEGIERRKKEMEVSPKESKPKKQRSPKKDHAGVASSKKVRRGFAKSNKNARRAGGNRKQQHTSAGYQRGGLRSSNGVMRTANMHHGLENKDASTKPANSWLYSGTERLQQATEHPANMPLPMIQPQGVVHPMNFHPSQPALPTTHNDIPAMFPGHFSSGMHPGFMPNQNAMPPMQTFSVPPPHLPPTAMHVGMPGLVPGMVPPLNTGSMIGGYPPATLPNMAGASSYGMPPGPVAHGNVVGLMPMGFNQAPMNNTTAYPVQNYDPSRMTDGNSVRQEGMRKKRRYSKKRKR